MQPLLWHISIEFFFYKIACDLKKKHDVSGLIKAKRIICRLIKWPSLQSLLWKTHFQAYLLFNSYFYTS